MNKIGRLIVIIGNSGSGKTEVVKHLLRSGNKDFHPVQLKRYTTRPIREKQIKQELAESYFVDEIPDSPTMKTYYVGKYKYGVDLNEINNLMRDGKSPIFATSDLKLIKSLRNSMTYFSITMSMKPIIMLKETHPKHKDVTWFSNEYYPTQRSFEHLVEKRGASFRSQIPGRVEKSTNDIIMTDNNMHLVDHIILNKFTPSASQEQQAKEMKQLHNIVDGKLEKILAKIEQDHNKSHEELLMDFYQETADKMPDSPQKDRILNVIDGNRKIAKLVQNISSIRKQQQTQSH